MNLKCAVCLYLDSNKVHDAMSIANGQAVCLEHFTIVSKAQTSDTGVPSLTRFRGI